MEEEFFVTQYQGEPVKINMHKGYFRLLFANGKSMKIVNQMDPGEEPEWFIVPDPDDSWDLNMADEIGKMIEGHYL